jgi:hypothetical protein
LYSIVSESDFDRLFLQRVFSQVQDGYQQVFFFGLHIHGFYNDFASKPALYRIAYRKLGGGSNYLIVRVKHQISQPTAEFRHIHPLTG